MRPTICELIRPLYPHVDIKDHEKVLEYPADPVDFGLRAQQPNETFIRFVNHRHAEQEDAFLGSPSNPGEAAVACQVIAHLARQEPVQGTPARITVLTPYVGQLMALKRELKRSRSTFPTRSRFASRQWMISKAKRTTSSSCA
jgi:hypothetical protein